MPCNVKENFLSYGLQEETEDLYPFECSGGMSRRILLSTALMGNTRLLIADEPTPGMELAMAKKPWRIFGSLPMQAMGYF